MALKIGEVAERSGVNLQTILYYERQKLLPEPPRLPSGYRMFPEQTVRRVRFIKRAQELGFSLAEIRDLLSIQVDPKEECSDVKRLATAQMADIDEKIRTLDAMSVCWVDLRSCVRAEGRRVSVRFLKASRQRDSDES